MASPDLPSDDSYECTQCKARWSFGPGAAPLASPAWASDDSYECTRCKLRESDVGFAPTWCRCYCARCAVMLLRAYNVKQTAGRKLRALQGTRFYLNYLLRRKRVPRALLRMVFDFLS